MRQCDYRGRRPKCSTSCITARAVKTGPDIVDHDTRSFGKTFELSHRGRLHDIEPSKKYKAQQQRFPRHWSRNQSDELAGDFVDHDKLRIFQAAGPCHAGGGGNSDASTATAAKSDRRPGLPRGRERASQEPPQENGGGRAPGSGSRTQAPNAEESGDERSPQRTRGRRTRPRQLGLCGRRRCRC